MAQKSKTQQLTDTIAGQHLALSVAAHLARTQLVPEPLKVYDGQHMSEMLNVVGQALARTTTLYVTEPKTGEARPLTPLELEGATARRGAMQLVLRDGRALGGVSVRRADLRQAIAILKTIGLEQIAPHLVAKPAAAEPPPNETVSAAALLGRVSEVEALLKPPLLPAQVERAKSAAVWIARHSTHGRVANLAMQLMSALHDPRALDEVPGGFRMALARLRAALQDTASTAR